MLVHFIGLVPVLTEELVQVVIDTSILALYANDKKGEKYIIETTFHNYIKMDVMTQTSFMHVAYIIIMYFYAIDQTAVFSYQA